VLLTSLGVIATIVGPKTKLELQAGSTKAGILHCTPAYNKNSPLYITVLCEPGSGKTAAHYSTVQKVLEEHGEELNSIVLRVCTN